jgi:hypothetical protein
VGAPRQFWRSTIQFAAIINRDIVGIDMQTEIAPVGARSPRRLALDTKTMIGRDSFFTSGWNAHIGI